MVISRAENLWRVRWAKAEEKVEVSQEVLLKRLRRIEGQIRGMEKMIVDGYNCVSLVIQLAAVRSSIESIGALALGFNCSHKLCLRHPGNHHGDRADGEYTHRCQTTRVFEDMSKLGGKSVQESLQ